MGGCIRNTIFRGPEGIPALFLRVFFWGIKATKNLQP